MYLIQFVCSTNMKPMISLMA